MSHPERCQEVYTDNLSAELLSRYAAEQGTEDTAQPLSPKEVKWCAKNRWDAKPRTR
jgi:hypothetical protein